MFYVLLLTIVVKSTVQWYHHAPTSHHAQCIQIDRQLRIYQLKIEYFKNYNGWQNGMINNNKIISLSESVTL